MSLIKDLEARLSQLENRKMMIPRYVENPVYWAGKTHFNLDMLPPLQFEIDETKAAIRGIDQWKKERNKKTT